MILSAQSIRNHCANLHPLIFPFVERGVFNGMSFGLSASGYDVRVAEDISLCYTGGVYGPSRILASTIERFILPNNIQFRVIDKSTWARRFVSVFNTKAEPGWEGHLTIEIINHSTSNWHIPAGTPIAQIEFQYLDHPTLQPYTGKYQNQESAPVPARLEDE